jgi:hypothetical protein
VDKKSATITTAIFGSSDGLVASIALILATMTHGQKVVLAAVFGLLIAEGLGMAASEFLADPKRDVRQALVMGGATSLAIILPGLPWTAASGNAAAVISGVIALVLAGLIAWARPGGWTTWAQTYGILIGVSVIATIAGHLT